MLRTLFDLFLVLAIGTMYFIILDNNEKNKEFRADTEEKITILQLKTDEINGELVNISEYIDTAFEMIDNIIYQNNNNEYEEECPEEGCEYEEIPLEHEGTDQDVREDEDPNTRCQINWNVDEKGREMLFGLGYEAGVATCH